VQLEASLIVRLRTIPRVIERVVIQ